MAFFRTTFSLLTGTVFGIYIAHLEETYRKPKKRDSDETEA